MTGIPIKLRQRMGKYRIVGRLGEGAFATVFKAIDTLEGVPVALKIPHDHLVTDNVLADFRREIQLTARLKHPNILPLKTADFIEGRLVLVYPLGERNLAERLQTRIALKTVLDYADQMLAAAAYAHEYRVVHCDIKPANLILFSDGELMLTDFGIAKVSLHTLRGSGSGTIGYCAPEQAMGKPSFRSDVFALGLILYRMLSGNLPEWPFDWPPLRHDRVCKRVHPELLRMIRRAIEIPPRKRFADAVQMHASFLRIKPRALLDRGQQQTANSSHESRHWRTVQRKQFQRMYGKTLATRYTCTQCEGPVAEAMTTCPWCGLGRPVHRDVTVFQFIALGVSGV